MMNMSARSPNATERKTRCGLAGSGSRMGSVHRLRVGIGAVLGIARPVVGQRHALVERLERPADIGAGRLRALRYLARLVDVVAQVEHEIEVVALSHPPVAVEETGVELR